MQRLCFLIVTAGFRCGLWWTPRDSIPEREYINNYAVSGGVCSNAITPEIFKIMHDLFPDLDAYGIPALFAGSQYTLPNGTKFMDISSESTVLAIMIWGDDVGTYAFLTDSQVPGKTIPGYIDCVFNQIDHLYQHVARYFIQY